MKLVSIFQSTDLFINQNNMIYFTAFNKILVTKDSIQ